jgi:MraZ protein
MLLGEFEARIDTKGRVAFPSKFRKSLGDQLIITKGYEQTLIIVSEKNWQTLLEGTEGKPLIQAETREVQRFLLGGASDVELDGKGRFLLPSYLREFAVIGQEIVFLGLSRYIEVWSRERWDEHKKILEQNIGRISEKLVPWEVKTSKHE